MPYKFFSHLKITPKKRYVMGRLKNHLNGEVIHLHPHHTFGRHRSKSETVLISRDISKIHASIVWEEEQCKIVDHSRNGTWLNNNRLEIANSINLTVGDTIQFGGAINSSWQVLDLSPPRPLLIPLHSDEPSIELDRLLALPDEELPALVIYQSDHNQWRYDDDSNSFTLKNGDIIHNNGLSWKFVAVEKIEPTLSSKKEKKNAIIRFRFRVSPDEEHVALHILQDQQTIDLGKRVHHYPLLVLARQRLKDAGKGLDSISQGWIESQQFCSMLKMDYFHVNTQIYRARKQISQVIPKGQNLPKVIERRDGRLRFGSANLIIQSDDSLGKLHVS